MRKHLAIIWGEDFSTCQGKHETFSGRFSGRISEQISEKISEKISFQISRLFSETSFSRRAVLINRMRECVHEHSSQLRQDQGLDALNAENSATFKDLPRVMQHPKPSWSLLHMSKDLSRHTHTITTRIVRQRTETHMPTEAHNHNHVQTAADIQRVPESI